MRILLAALECAKGDPAANLAAHRTLLHEARRAGCELVAFPEMSLTGSVDPVSHPERLVTLEDPVVQQVVDATRRASVAAVFGIAERRGGLAHITQVFACGGEVLGVQRKRHLGEDELGFTAADETATFELGAARLGAVICAESAVAHTWDASTRGGAQLVVLAAAPGLTGRRREEAAWRAGLDWWESAGLADARHHARRLGVWVAMATQAGSAEDEDFPGVAALVDPSGEVVDRLPDWRPGTLLADVPISTDVEPVRQAVRVLVVDRSGRALLAQYGDDRTGHRWWVPPGGGMEAGEDDLATARRELREELLRDDLVLGPQLGRRGGTFRSGGRWLTQYERWYLCRCDSFEVDPAHVEQLEAEGIRDLRWWSAAELRSAGVDTAPRDLAELLEQVLAGGLPDPQGDLGR